MTPCSGAPRRQNNPMTTALDQYRLLGRTGLRVSPLSLGAMTFGTDFGWGTAEPEAQRIFDAYIDRGGNFIDTANIYTFGTSEAMVGRFSKTKRHRCVIATKYSNGMDPGDPNSAGNHRKNMVRSLEDSLRRLDTDYVDILYLHAWDGRTGADEVLRAFDDLISAGKVLYPALSDIPAWQASRMQAIAELRALAPIAAIQVEYSLIERSVDWELMPMARACGMGIVPWSPLGGGILSGKYARSDADAAGVELNIEADSRRALNLAQGKVTQRALDIADVAANVARERGMPTAAVALAWVMQRPGVTSTIIGARTFEQFEQNLLASEVTLTAKELTLLDAASGIPAPWPHSMLSLPYMRHQLSGGVTVEDRI